MEVLLLRDWLILVRPPLIPVRVNCYIRVRLFPPHSFWVLQFGLDVYFLFSLPRHHDVTVKGWESKTCPDSTQPERTVRVRGRFRQRHRGRGFSVASYPDPVPSIERRCSSCRQQLPSPLQPHSTAIKLSFCLQELQWQELWRGSLCRVTGVHSMFASVVDILEGVGRITKWKMEISMESTKAERIFRTLV